MSPVAIAAAVIFGLSLLGNAFLWHGLGSERDKRAEAEASMRQWQATALECSAATEKAEADAKKRATIAAAALKQARTAAQSSQAEIARLRASNGATCEGAVKEVRRGLR